MNKVISYLLAKNVFKNITKTEKISTGASGAELYFITDTKNEFVLKVAPINNENIESYEKELSFYKINQALCLSFVPQIIHMESHANYGIILMMKRYKPVSYSEWNRDLQFKVVDLCAKLNSISPDNLSELVKFTPSNIDRVFIENSYKEWKFVLSQHKGCFDEQIIDDIYKNLDLVCPVLNSEPHYVCHGDFHPENILVDGDNLLICDWQNIGIGKSVGDISFFISRGAGFGININADELFDFYCDKLSEYKGTLLQKSILIKERYAAALLNMFSFWAHYLKDCDRERVAAQYDEMVKAYNYLTS